MHCILSCQIQVKFGQLVGYKNSKIIVHVLYNHDSGWSCPLKWYSFGFNQLWIVCWTLDQAVYLYKLGIFELRLAGQEAFTLLWLIVSFSTVELKRLSEYFMALNIREIQINTVDYFSRVWLYYLNCSLQKPSSDLEQNVSKSKEKKKKPKKTAAAANELHVNGKVELEGRSKLKHVEPLTFKVLSCNNPLRPLSNNEASLSALSY